MSPLALCVVCVSERRDVVNMSSLYYGSIPASTFIMDILQIKVASDTSSGVVMCNRCNSSLNNFYKFYKMVRDAQHKYNDMKLQLQDVVVRSGEICFVNVKPEPEVSTEDMEVESMKEEYLDDVVVEDSNEFTEQDDIKPISLDTTSISEPKPDNKITNKKAETKGRGKRKSKVTPRSQKATETLLTKYKVEDIFSGGEWKISEEEKDEIFQLYIDMKCNKCEAHFSNYNLLDQHCTTIHDESALVTCDDFTLPSYQHMERHILYKHILRARVVKADVMIKCLVCSKVIKGENMKTHLATHLPHDERDYQCKQCNAGFVTIRRLNIHTRDAHSTTNFPCKECGKLLKSKLSLGDHMRHLHGTSDVHHLCPHCGQIFKSSSNFAIHVKKHRGIVDKVTCKICDKVVKKISYFTHMYNHGLKKQRKRSPNRERRTRVKSDNEKIKILFDCMLCPKKFNSMKDMDDHVSGVHDENRRYMCEFCSKAFILKRHYEAHRKRVHDEKPKNLEERIKSYACTLCEKAYYKKMDLENHIAASHIGIPRYTCEFCRKRFMSSGNIRRHRKLMHPEELAEQKMATGIDVVLRCDLRQESDGSYHLAGGDQEGANSSCNVTESTTPKKRKKNT